ncbi:MAG: nitroreductase [Magnetococcales bacterium]|nr:nitroreductase [Magnetococcales bacterium]
MDLIQAIEGRRSVRGFSDRSVSRQTLTAILQCARWSPSGVNLQPWRVEVVQGEVLRTLAQRLTAAAESGVPKNPDYHYHPNTWKEPYRGRRRDCGYGLLHAMGIDQGDGDGRKRAWLANYSFFNAPAVMLLFMDRSLGQGAWMDMGMFVQTILLTAHAYGLGVCPQASTAEYPDIVRQVVHVDRQYLFLCSLAMGYADHAAPANTLRTTRLEVEAFARFHG